MSDELTHEELRELVLWVDRKLDQCDFKRCRDHGLIGCIQGSMHNVVSDSHIYRRFVSQQKVADNQKEIARQATELRESLQKLQEQLRLPIGYEGRSYDDAVRDLDKIVNDAMEAISH